MKKLLLISLLSLFFIGCGSYNYSSYYQVENVLAVTKSGDTIQVPLSEIKNNYKYNYYNNWQFYNGASWLYWNDLYIRYPWYNAFNREFFYPQYRYYLRNSNLRPQRTPIYRPRPNTPNRVNDRPKPGVTSPLPPRPPRTKAGTRPMISRPNNIPNTRVRTTPNVIQRNNTGRGSSGGNRSSSKGKPID